MFLNGEKMYKSPVALMGFAAILGSIAFNPISANAQDSDAANTENSASAPAQAAAEIAADAKAEAKSAADAAAAAIAKAEAALEAAATAEAEAKAAAEAAAIAEAEALAAAEAEAAAIAEAEALAAAEAEAAAEAAVEAGDQAGEVELRSADGLVAVVGRIIDFDDSIITIDTSYGRVGIENVDIECIGAECPPELQAAR